MKLVRKVLLSYLISVPPSWLLLFLLERKFQIHTQIVGYPMFANFNVNYVFFKYLICSIISTLFACLAYCWLNRFKYFQTHHNFLVESELVETHRAAPNFLENTQFDRIVAVSLNSFFGVAKVLFVGFILGLGTLNAPQFWGLSFFQQCSAIAVFYLILLMLVSSLVKNFPQFQLISLFERFSFINALFIPFTLIPLYQVSRNTTAETVGHAIEHYYWLPTSLFLVLFGLSLGAVYSCLKKGFQTQQFSLVESNLVLFVPVSVFIFLRSQGLPGNANGLDMFHSGEGLVPGYLISKGYFPWRDIVAIHGLMQDYFTTWLGFHFFGNNIWGSWAGMAMIWHPLYRVVQYLWLAMIFKSNKLMLLVTAFLLPAFISPYLFGVEHSRFLFYPFIISCFYFLLKKKTKPLVFVFSLLTLFIVITVPESTYCLPSFAFALLACDYSQRKMARPSFLDFKLSFQVFACLCFLLSIWFWFLAQHQALGEFFRYYLTFAEDHRYTGAFPLNWPTTQPDRLYMQIWFYTPMFCNSLTIWYFFLRLKKMRQFSPLEWTLLACAIMSAFYYQKGISRPDGHMASGFYASIPVIYIALSLLLKRLDLYLADRVLMRSGSWATLVLILAGFVFDGHIAESDFWTNSINTMPVKFKQAGFIENSESRLGYSENNALNLKLIEYRKFFKAYLGPDDTFFDFSNSPGLYYYLLDIPLSNPYFHISMAMPKSAQLDLISRLEAHPPKIISFIDPGGGLGDGWDGVRDTIRHHHVSNYILRNYKPFVFFDRVLFLQRKDQNLPSPRNLGFNMRNVWFVWDEDKIRHSTKDEFMYVTNPCDWGFSSYYLSQFDSVPTSTFKQINMASAFSASASEIEIPLTEELMSSNYLEFEFEFPTAIPSQVEISDQRDSKNRGNKIISFQLLPEKLPHLAYQVQVGSCIQWYLFQGDRIYLKTTNGVKIKNIRSSRFVYGSQKPLTPDVH